MSYTLAAIILIAPYVISYSFLDTKWEAYAHTVALIPFMIVFPVWLLHLFLSFKIDPKHKKIEIFSKIFGFLISLVLMFYVSLSFIGGVIALIKNHYQFETLEGYVEDVNSNAKGFILKYQSIWLEGHDKSYSYMYGHSWVYSGDKVKIQILPKAGDVVSLEILERAK